MAGSGSNDGVGGGGPKWNVDPKGLGGFFKGIGRALGGKSGWSSGTSSGKGAPLLGGKPGDDWIPGPPILKTPAASQPRAPRAAAPAGAPAPTYPAGAPYETGGPPRRYSAKRRKNRPWWEICPTMDLDCVRENYQEVQRSWTQQTLLQLMPSMFMGSTGTARGGGLRTTTKLVRAPARVPATGPTMPNVVRVERGPDWAAIAAAPPTYSGPLVQQALIPSGRSFMSESIMARDAAASRLDPMLAEVKVTAQRVGTITAPAPDDRHAVADLVAEPLTEVEVTGKYIVGPTGGDTWMEHYYGAGRARADTANAAYPGPGQTATNAGTSRSTRPASAPTAGPGTARAPTRVALPNLGAPKLLVDALVAAAAGAIRGRSRRARAPSFGIGATNPATGPATGGALAPLTFGGFPGFATATRTDDCTCDKPKRKPRAPRAECWKGSYVETARGLRKTRRERVTC
jgi:hypothetical protein